MTVEMSRSEQKRRLKELEKLVAELSSLPSSLIDKLPCSEEIRSYFHEASTMKGSVRNRHVKYITKMLKAEPVDELYSFLSEKRGKSMQVKKEFHEIEYLREELLSEAIEQHRVAKHDHKELEEDWPSQIAEKICSDYPGINKILITRLSLMYARTRNSRHSRELFRIIRAAHEQSVYSREIDENSKD